MATAEPSCPPHRWRIAPNGQGACACGATRTFLTTFDDVMDARRGPMRGAAIKQTFDGVFAVPEHCSPPDEGDDAEEG